MVREPRLNAPVILHHFMARGIERRPVFIDDRDIDEFVRCLSEIPGLPVGVEWPGICLGY
jgi:hypothetical protein